ncbi:hypothetical protein MIR68_009969 [Amoeboaphelidium protococcarum]|nr:hypothetical protein MIR68_009969 [Amoeboaphelidium protococcarum]
MAPKLLSLDVPVYSGDNNNADGLAMHGGVGQNDIDSFEASGSGAARVDSFFESFDKVAFVTTRANNATNAGQPTSQPSVPASSVATFQGPGSAQQTSQANIPSTAGGGSQIDVQILLNAIQALGTQLTGFDARLSSIEASSQASQSSSTSSPPLSAGVQSAQTPAVISSAQRSDKLKLGDYPRLNLPSVKESEQDLVDALAVLNWLDTIDSLMVNGLTSASSVVSFLPILLEDRARDFYNQIKNSSGNISFLTFKNYLLQSFVGPPIVRSARSKLALLMQAENQTCLEYFDQVCSLSRLIGMGHFSADMAIIKFKETINIKYLASVNPLLPVASSLVDARAVLQQIDLSFKSQYQEANGQFAAGFRQSSSNKKSNSQSWNPKYKVSKEQMIKFLKARDKNEFPHWGQKHVCWHCGNKSHEIINCWELQKLAADSCFIVTETEDQLDNALQYLEQDSDSDGEVEQVHGTYLSDRYQSSFLQYGEIKTLHKKHLGSMKADLTQSGRCYNRPAMTVGFINSIEVKVCIDSGASGALISARDAQRCGLQIQITQSTPVKGIGDTVCMGEVVASLTLCTISGQKVELAVKFDVVEADIPLLLGNVVHSQLSGVIDLANNIYTCTVNGDQVSVPFMPTSSSQNAYATCDFSDWALIACKMVEDHQIEICTKMEILPARIVELQVSGVKDGSAKVCIPQSLRQKILQEAHDSKFSAHTGVHKMFKTLIRIYYWKSIVKDIQSHCEKCIKCAQMNYSTTRLSGQLTPTGVPPSRWHTIAMDFTGPFTRPGVPYPKYVLVVVDCLSKRCHLIEVAHNATAKEVADLFVLHIFKYHGLPKKIISDRDPKFTAEFWKCLMSNLGTKLALSTAHHPQTDGQSERSIRTIQQLLRCTYQAEAGRDWEILLALVEFAYNNSVHSSTGYCPFELDNGTSPLSPLSFLQAISVLVTNNPNVDEFINTIHLKLARAQENLLNLNNALVSKDPIANQMFHQGDLVMVSNELLKQLDPLVAQKLQPRYYGPFEILEVVSPNSYKVNLPPHFRHHRTINIQFLKMYQELSSHSIQVDECERQYPEAEVIVASRMTAEKKKLYLVRFKNSTKDDDTWVSEDLVLKICPELLDKFMSSNKLKFPSLRAYVQRRGEMLDVLTVSQVMKIESFACG